MPSNRRILLVEDEAEVAAVVAEILERDGYVCRHVSDGRSALEEVPAYAPELIILDRGLPGCSGDDVLRELKRDPATARIPVIMLTGKADESDQLVGFALGADDYVCKPFSGKLLLARVDSLLRRTPPSAERARLPVPVVSPIRLDRAQSIACVGDRMVTLSKIEYRILATLIAARGRVLEGKVLLGLAVGRSDDPPNQRIESHIATLQKKLGPASPCIQEVRGVGYAYCSPDANTPGTPAFRSQS